MFNIEKAHFIIDEMIMNGQIVETNKTNVLNPVIAVVKTAETKWRISINKIKLSYISITPAKVSRLQNSEERDLYSKSKM